MLVQVGRRQLTRPSARSLQVVRVRSREARRIREPPKRFRASDNKKDGARPGGAGGPGGAAPKASA